MKALALFHDDSSLFVARRFADDLRTLGHDTDFMRVDLEWDQNGRLSKRQLELGLRDLEPRYHRPSYHAFDERVLPRYDVVAAAKYPIVFRWRITTRAWNFRGKRPCFLALYSGLEFLPELGFRMRGSFDVVCLNTPFDLSRYTRAVPNNAPPHQRAVVYHPSFVLRAPQTKAPKNELVFFPQSVTPSTREARVEILQLLLKIKKGSKGLRIIIKLRHLESENRRNTHQEMFPYRDLAKTLGSEDQFTFVDGPVEDVLPTAARVITCSSTAGIEAIAAGIPTAFLTGFHSWQDDKIARRSVELLSPSGLVHDMSSSNDISFGLGNEEWRSQYLYDRSSIHDVETAVQDFLRDPPADTGWVNKLRALVLSPIEYADYWIRTSTAIKPVRKP